MKKNLVMALAAVMLVGGMTVNVNAEGESYGTDKLPLTSDTETKNSSNKGTTAESAEDQGLKGADIPVNITTNADQQVIHVYGVSCDTTDLTYTYGASTSIVWNPELRKYEFDDTRKEEGNLWSDNGEQTITVRNYSDLPVKIEAEYVKSDVSPENGVNVSVSTSPIKLDSVVPSEDKPADKVGTIYDYERVASGEFTITVSGTPQKSYTSVTQIGTVKLKVTGNPSDYTQGSY